MSPTEIPQPTSSDRGALVGRLTGVRAVAVLFGAPLVLLGAFIAAGVDVARSLCRGSWPRAVSSGVLAVGLAYVALIRPWAARWGATPGERGAAMVGDETVPHPSLQVTHAVAIDSPAAAVWPWLAQIGQDRAGFYSYTWLENLAGCRMRNADNVREEWQGRGVGEIVALHPNLGLELVRLEPGRAFVMQDGWYFNVTPDGPSRCRVQARYRAPPGLGGRAFGLLFELPHFIMQRGMLLGLKRRAERAGLQKSVTVANRQPSR